MLSKLENSGKTVDFLTQLNPSFIHITLLKNPVNIYTNKDKTAGK